MLVVKSLAPVVKSGVIKSDWSSIVIHFDVNIDGPEGDCGSIFTDAALALLDDGAGDAECRIRANKLRVILGAKDNVKDGSVLGFRSGNGIVSAGSDPNLSEEVDPSVTIVKLAAQNAERPKLGVRKVTFDKIRGIQELGWRILFIHLAPIFFVGRPQLLHENTTADLLRRRGKNGCKACQGLCR
jgi:hypothetical protein